jgi:hypothetical protein
LARRTARRRLLRSRRASGCLSSSCGSSSTTSPTSRVRVPQLVARRLIRLHRASGCLDSSHGLSSTTSPTPHVRVPRLIVDYFAYTARSGGSACWLVVDYLAHIARPGASARSAARRRLLRLCRASRCLSSSRGPSSTTSPTPHVQVPRLVRRLVVSYFAYAVRSGASAPCVARRRPRAVSPLDFSSVGCTGSHCAPGHSVSRLDYLSPGCNSSTAPTLCIRMRYLAARLLIGRLH